MLFSLCVFARSHAEEPAEPRFSAADLTADFALAERAYRTLHPSLTRHLSWQRLDAHFEQYRQAFDRDMTLAEAYLTWSRFLAGLQDGHTYANFYNQKKAYRAALFDGADKLPFTFRLLDQTALTLTRDVSAAGLPPGTRITAIDGRSVADLIADLMTLIKGDGPRADLRLYGLGITGEGRYEPFDIYQPLLILPVQGQYQLEVELPDGTERALTVAALSRAERASRLTEGAPQAPIWQKRREADTLILRLRSFAMFNTDFDWQGFLQGVERDLASRDVAHLVLDVRGNSGGEGHVAAALLKLIADRDLVAPEGMQTMAFQVAPEDLKPHLGTWDPSFYDFSDRSSARCDGLFVLQNEARPLGRIARRPGAYSGPVTLLVARLLPH